MTALMLTLAQVAWADCTVVAGATVHTDDGPQKGLTVVIEDDRIAAMGRGLPGLKLQLDARQQVSGSTWNGAACGFIQGGGKVLTAGLIAAPTNLGLVEISLEQGSRDDDPHTDDPVRAALRVADAYDPRSTAIPVNRIEGITGAVISAGGGFVSGQAAYVQLRGATQAEAVVDPMVAMSASVPTASSAEGFRQLRELFADVGAWSRDPASFDRGRPSFEGATRLDLQALGPVARGEMPLMVGADDASDLEALVRLQEELGIRLIIVGAAEGWLVADALAAADIPVVLDPLVYGPGGFSQVHGREDNAALLVAAGVKVIITSGAYSAHNLRTLRQVAGNAVRGGLAHADALAAITSTPAAVFGQADRGRVLPGSKADLVLWTGDPLELTTWVDHLWIGGQPVALESRQTKLTEKYRTLPGTPATPLALPE